MQKHLDLNQKNYMENPGLNAKFNQVNSTIYLVYRDFYRLIKKYIFDKIENKNKVIKVLDYGCGDGLSSKIILEIIKNEKYPCKLVGVDINEVQISMAKKQVPCEEFHLIKEGESLKNEGSFDLIICNFVLLEQNTKEKLEKITQIIFDALQVNGIAIFTNNTSNVYHPDNKYFNVESLLTREELRKSTGKSQKLMPKDGQSVATNVREEGGGKKMTYYDFFYSGKTYVQSFFKVGFNVPETWKPTAHNDIHCPWKNEGTFSDDKPMYRIDICHKGEFQEKNLKISKLELFLGKQILRISP